jgi:hypothetical protein
MVPGNSERGFTIRGLRPRKYYKLSNGERLVTDAEGTLRFRAPADGIVEIRHGSD